MCEYSKWLEELDESKINKHKYINSIEAFIPTHIPRIVEIMRGLPEWFTDNALTGAESASHMKGYVAVVDGDVRGFIILGEGECCVEIEQLAVKRFPGPRDWHLPLSGNRGASLCSWEAGVLTPKNLRRYGLRIIYSHSRVL